MKFLLSLFFLSFLSACQSSPKSSDLYRNFAHLKSNEDASAYKVESVQRKSEVLILVPHGGNIEFGTSRIAKSLAGKDWSYYSFNGLLKSGNSRLHITSRNFDEPVAISMTAKHEVCLSIHGYKNQLGDANICFGGRNDELGQRLHLRLRELGLQNTDDFNSCGSFYGQAESNIVNRCDLEGVQMEISRSFREELIKSSKLRKRFEKAIREIVAQYFKEVRQ